LFKKLFIILIYCVLLDLIYVLLLNPVGFTFSRENLDPSILKYIYSYLFCTLAGFFIPRSSGRFSGITIILIYIIIVVPTVQISKYTSPDFYQIISLVAFSLAIMLFINKFLYFKFKTPKFKENIGLIFVFSLFFISCFVFFNVFGITPKVFSFSSKEVYALRTEGISQRYNLFVRYILSWYPWITFGIMQWYLFIKLKPFWSFSLVFLGFLNFSVSSHKIYFVLPIAVFAFLWLFQKKKCLSISELTLFYCSAIFLFYLLSLFIDPILIKSLIDRIIPVHADLFSKYYAFFSHNPKTFWGYSFLKGLVEYPYSEWPGLIIGYHGYGSNIANANAHFLADGYANAGYWGVAIYSIFIISYCKIIDAFDVSFLFSLLFSFIFVMFISSTSPFTAMLTAGFVWLPLVLLLGIGRRDEILCPERHPVSCDTATYLM